MFGLSISQNSKTITQNSSPCHISKLYLSKKSKTEKSCLVYNPNPCISTFSLFGGAHSLHFQNGHMFLARVTFSLLSSKICLPRHTHTHTHQMLGQSPSALLFRLHIHRTHLQQTPKEISQSSLVFDCPVFASEFRSFSVIRAMLLWFPPLPLSRTNPKIQELVDTHLQQIPFSFSSRPIISSGPRGLHIWRVSKFCSYVYVHVHSFLGLTCLD